MDVAIERFVAVAFFGVGLSHLLQPRGWAEWFAQLRARGAPGAFVNGMMSLTMGALIVAFHGGEWSGLRAIVTFIGWAQVFKGVLHLCLPSHSLRSMAQVPPDKAWKIAVAGGVMLPLSALIFVGTLGPR
jgi:hypothetical protein